MRKLASIQRVLELVPIKNADRIEMAKGKYESGYPQEGIVICPVEPVFSEVLCDRLSMKVINNQFLLK